MLSYYLPPLPPQEVAAGTVLAVGQSSQRKGGGLGPFSQIDSGGMLGNPWIFKYFEPILLILEQFAITAGALFSTYCALSSTYRLCFSTCRFFRLSLYLFIYFFEKDKEKERKGGGDNSRGIHSFVHVVIFSSTDFTPIHRLICGYLRPPYFFDINGLGNGVGPIHVSTGKYAPPLFFFCDRQAMVHGDLGGDL